MSTKLLLQAVIAGISVLVLSACSFNGLSTRLSSVFIEYKVDSIYREKDLLKVKVQLPENIKLLESMIAENEGNQDLRIYAAQAYYSYAFAFIEDSDIKYATSLYSSSYQHAVAALALHGVSVTDLQGNTSQLKKKITHLPKRAIDALYWTAVSWAKLIEIKQPDVLLFTQLHKTAVLMNRVIKLDESYHLGGPYLFFGVYYSGRSVYLGGDVSLAGKYFERARSHNNNRLLIVDFLQAKYLNGRVNGEAKFIQRLNGIINAPDDLYPEQALMNAVAKQKAAYLLSVNHG